MTILKVELSSSLRKCSRKMIFIFLEKRRREIGKAHEQKIVTDVELHVLGPQSVTVRAHEINPQLKFFPPGLFG